MLSEIIRLFFDAEDLPDRPYRFGDHENTREAAKAFSAMLDGISREKRLELDAAHGECLAVCAEEEYARGFREGVRLAVCVVLSAWQD